MVKRTFLLLLFLPSILWAQNTKVDSLNRLLSLAKSDTARLRYRYEIASESKNFKVETYESINTEAKRLKLRKIEGNCMAALGNIYRNTGDLGKATNCYIACLKIMQELNDKKGAATATNGLGLIYRATGDTLKAIEYFNEAYEIAEGIGYKEEMSASLNSLAIVERNRGHYEKAVDYYSKSLALRIESKDDFGIAETTLNLGTLYKTRKEMTLAKDYLNKSYELFKKLKDNQGMSYSLNNLAGIYLGEKNYGDAEKYSKISLQLGRETGFPKMIRNASQTLYKIYNATGKYKDALDMHLLFIKMRDSISDQDLREASIKSSLKFDYDKKATADSVRVGKEKEVVAAQLAQEETQRYALYGGLLLTIVFGGFIFNRFRITQKQNKIIEQQKQDVDQKNLLIEVKQKEIIDSTNYAKRIQYTLLAHDDLLKSNLSSHFVLFKPKDIVSGDFYWATRKGDKFYLAVCDSTGHGVPGAFMSLLNIGFLAEAINEKGIEKPNEVFEFVRQRLIDNISKEGQKDGFDGILVCFDSKTKQVSYAAANNVPLVISNNTIIELEGDRIPVGISERMNTFKLHNITLKPGDMLYLYTDGYADQFGGPKGKKLKYKQLDQLLLSNHKESTQKQSDVLLEHFNSWKGSLEQVDDVLVMGIKV